jgi:transcriptional regulator with XRE-family HTH domain
VIQIGIPITNRKASSARLRARALKSRANPGGSGRDQLLRPLGRLTAHDGQDIIMDYSDLKAAREQAGHTLERIADATKISIRHLRALEEGRLRNWPRGVYVKAYAGAYARAVGLDPEVVKGIASRLIEDLDREAAPRVVEVSTPKWWQLDFRAWLIRA